MQRRDFFKNSILLSAASLPAMSFTGRSKPTLEDIRSAFIKHVGKSHGEVAKDEGLWNLVRSCFTVNTSELNMGTVVRGVAPDFVVDAVADTYQRMNERRPGGNYIRGQLENVRTRLSTWLNCSPDELALTRNTTDGVTTLINGVRLNAGDEILTTSQEHEPYYGALFQRRAKSLIDIKVVQLKTTGQTAEELMKAIEVGCTPRTKLIHICHVYLTGQISPIKEICSYAHEHGIRVLVDGALAVGHVPLDIKDLNCDFYAGSLHKWAAGPRGTGFLFVRKEWISDIYPLYGFFNEERQVVEFDSPDIRKFEAFGTHPESNVYSILQMLDFLEAIGIERIQARLHFLKRCWSDLIPESDKLSYCTSREQKQSASLLSFKLSPQHSLVPLKLWKEHRIILGGAYVNGTFGKPETWDEITLCNSALFHSEEDMKIFGTTLSKTL